MNFNWNALRFFLDMVVMFGVVAVGIYSWWISRNQAIKSDIFAVCGRVELVEERVTLVERDIRSMPTTADIFELNQRIACLHGDLREIKGTLKGLSRAVDLMNEHLISRGGKQ